MAKININNIMRKVRAYSRTDAGQKNMDGVIEQYKKDGKHTTEAGGRIRTETDMYRAAAKLIEVMQTTAKSYALPESVLEHYNDLRTSQIFEQPDGTAVMYIYFTDSLHRPSLIPDEYDGVDNIVAVLNNGYHARDYVYGYWDNHEPEGMTGWSYLDMRNIDSAAFIRSRKDRDGLHFMQQAVMDFNGNYGSDFNVTAEVGEDYR